jgi:hypothetical protein
MNDGDYLSLFARQHLTRLKKSQDFSCLAKSNNGKKLATSKSLSCIADLRIVRREDWHAPQATKNRGQ